MKKIFTLSAIALTLLASCKDSEPFSLDVHNVQLHYEETAQLKATKDVSKWSSENEFVAKVSDNGLITGNHVGTTQIIATDDKERDYCTVEILPKYSMYLEPNFAFGETISKVKSTTPYSSLLKETSEILIYEDVTCPYTTLVSYGFKKGTCYAILVLMQHNYSSLFSSTMANFLKERYALVDNNGLKFTFVDGYTEETIKKGILYDPLVENNPNTASVTYMPIDLTKGGISSRGSECKKFIDLDDLFEQTMSFLNE